MVLLADLVPSQVTALRSHQKSQVPLGDSNMVFCSRLLVMAACSIKILICGTKEIVTEHKFLPKASGWFVSARASSLSFLVTGADVPKCQGSRAGEPCGCG